MRGQHPCQGLSPAPPQGSPPGHPHERHPDPRKGNPPEAARPQHGMDCARASWLSYELSSLPSAAGGQQPPVAPKGSPSSVRPEGLCPPRSGQQLECGGHEGAARPRAGLLARAPPSLCTPRPPPPAAASRSRAVTWETCEQRFQAPCCWSHSRSGLAGALRCLREASRRGHALPPPQSCVGVPETRRARSAAVMAGTLASQPAARSLLKAPKSELLLRFPSDRKCSEISRGVSAASD